MPVEQPMPCWTRRRTSRSHPSHHGIPLMHQTLGRQSGQSSYHQLLLDDGKNLLPSKGMNITNPLKAA